MVDTDVVVRGSEGGVPGSVWIHEHHWARVAERTKIGFRECSNLLMGEASERTKHLKLLTGSIKRHLITAVVSVVFAELLLLAGFLAYERPGWVAAWAGASLVALFVTGLTGVSLARSSTTRVRRLRVAAAAIAAGDPDQRAPTVGREEPGDEVDQLARQINAIADQLRPWPEEPSSPNETDTRSVADLGALAANGLAATLRDIVEKWSQGTEIAITLDILADPELGRDAAAHELYQVAREALDNAERHSHAANAVLRLETDSREVRMTIADDGNGFDPGIQESTKGLGLRNMRDWMREADGLLLVQTALGRGTTIQAILPLLSTEDLSTQEEPKR